LPDGARDTLCISVALGSLFTDPVKNAWLKVCQTLKKVMTEARRTPSKSRKLSKPPKEEPAAPKQPAEEQPDILKRSLPKRRLLISLLKRSLLLQSSLQKSSLLC